MRMPNLAATHLFHAVALCGVLPVHTAHDTARDAVTHIVQPSCQLNIVVSVSHLHLGPDTNTLRPHVQWTHIEAPAHGDLNSLELFDLQPECAKARALFCFGWS